MEWLGIFGVVSLGLSVLLFSRVVRIERILRDNDIHPANAQNLASELQNAIGEQVVLNTLDEDGIKGEVLECDAEWVMLCSETFTKKKKIIILRIDDVEAMKILK